MLDHRPVERAVGPRPNLERLLQRRHRAGENLHRPRPRLDHPRQGLDIGGARLHRSHLHVLGRSIDRIGKAQLCGRAVALRRRPAHRIAVGLEHGQGGIERRHRFLERRNVGIPPADREQHVAEVVLPHGPVAGRGRFGAYRHRLLERRDRLVEHGHVGQPRAQRLLCLADVVLDLRPIGRVRLFRRQRQRLAIGRERRTQRLVVAGVVTFIAERIALADAEIGGPGLIPFLHRIERLAIELGRMPVVEIEHCRGGVGRIGVGDIEHILPQPLRLGLLAGKQRVGPRRGLVAELQRQPDGALRLGVVGQPGEPFQLGVGAHRFRALGDQLLQPLRPLLQLLLHVAGTVIGPDAEGIEHAVERIERHLLGARELLDIFLRLRRRRGDRQQQLAPFGPDRLVIGIVALRRRRVEGQHAPQRGIGPRQLPGPGLEVDFLADHGHHVAERIAAGGEMLEQRRGVGRILARRTVERRLARAGREPDHRAEAVRVERLAGDRHWAADRRQPLALDRCRRGLTGQHDHLPGRERIGAARVEQHDRHRGHLGQFVEDRLHRDHARAGARRTRKVGVGRGDEVLSLRLDAVPRIVDQRDVGILGVLLELRDRIAEFTAVGIEHPVDLEAEVAQQPVDVARILGRIGQHRQLLVLALPDHQRHAMHWLLRHRGERRGRQQCDEGEAAHHFTDFSSLSIEFSLS